jgi:hypothetical protein
MGRTGAVIASGVVVRLSPLRGGGRWWSVVGWKCDAVDLLFGSFDLMSSSSDVVKKIRPYFKSSWKDSLHKKEFGRGQLETRLVVPGTGIPLLK